MTVHELNREQLDQLKMEFVADMANVHGEDISYGELLDAPATVSDEQIYKHYDGYIFSEEDFPCDLDHRY